MISEVTIETLGAQGDGVTADGIFVPGVLPGEKVRVIKTGHRASLVEIVQSSSSRITPLCPQFGVCGGCALQHASHDLVSAWKQELVERALSARGLNDIEIRPILTSPTNSRRRITLAGRRTKRAPLVGFHAPASDEIIAIARCDVALPELVDVIPALSELVQTGASRKGTLRMTVTTSEQGLDVAVSGGKPVEGPMYGQLVAIAATWDFARLSWQDEPVVTRRPPYQCMGRTNVVPPPGSFLQATLHGEAVLVTSVTEAMRPARRIADLFCGSGTFSLPLAENAEITAVEADADALSALDTAWRQAEGLRKIKTEARDLFHRPLLAREFKDFDGVVFDPPRQGARTQTEQLAKSDVPCIAAVSCNPATFARDARTLVDAGYRLDWIQPIDQFRWSPHVELAAAFIRE